MGLNIKHPQLPIHFCSDYLLLSHSALQTTIIYWVIYSYVRNAVVKALSLHKILRLEMIFIIHIYLHMFKEQLPLITCGVLLLHHLFLNRLVGLCFILFSLANVCKRSSETKVVRLLGVDLAVSGRLHEI